MRARKNFSYLALLSLQSAPIRRKGKRPSLNLGDDTNFFAQFECAPLSSIIRRGVLWWLVCSIYETESRRKTSIPLTEMEGKLMDSLRFTDHARGQDIL